MGLSEAAILKITLFLPPNLEDSTGLGCINFNLYTHTYIQIHTYIWIYVPRNTHVYKEIHLQTLQTWAESHLPQRGRAESEGPFPFTSSVDSHDLPWQGLGNPHQTSEKFPWEIPSGVWNLCILCEIYPYLKVTFCPSAFSIFKI